MNLVQKLLFLILFLGTVTPSFCESTESRTSKPNTNPQVIPSATSTLPKLLELGSSHCMPCKMMTPILEQLKKDYAGQLSVEFLDVRKNPTASSSYKIEVIPTQIFLSPDGKELFRHSGFFSKDDIVAKWKELGFILKKP